MAELILTERKNIVDIADAVRDKLGITEEMTFCKIVENIESMDVGDGVALPTLTNEGNSSDLLLGKELVDGKGKKITGTIETKTSSNITASGATITVPAGYYASQTSKSIATATQATPSITVDSAGKITASATQAAGYVNAGTKSSTHQLAFQPAKTIVPSTTSQIAVSSGYYTGGNITVAGDSNLVAGNIKRGISIFGVSGAVVDGQEVEDKFVNGDFLVYDHYENNRVSKIGDGAFAYTTIRTASLINARIVGTEAFRACRLLSSVNLPIVEDVSFSAFYYCDDLTGINLPAVKTIRNNAFEACFNLISANFQSVEKICSNAFYRCSTLSSLTIGCFSVCTLSNSNAFSLTPYTGYSTYFSGTPYIYVPSSLITSYQAATNWTYFSSYFSAIEDAT